MPPSRRALLSAATAAATALAGCSGTGSTASDSANERSVPDGNGDDPPPYAYLRGDDPQALARFEDDDRTRGRHHPHLERLVLDSEDRAASVEYADVDGADAVREFVTETAFETETVVVDQWAVEACYRLELCGVHWTETDLDLAYSRVALAHDVPCGADAEAAEARFLRLPDALDDESLSSFSTSIDRGGCPERHEPVAGSEFPGRSATDTTASDGRVRPAASTDGGTR